MKKITLHLFLLISTHIFAQVGINTENPDPKSVLDVFSTDKGFLLPRLTTTKMNTLVTGGLTEGMIIYNTTLKQFMGWDGTQWINLSYEKVNTPPQVSGAFILGTLEVGQTLTGVYSYSDTQSDPDDASIYQWKMADDTSGSNETVISNATTTTYSLTASEANKFIQFCVTGGSSSGVSPGSQHCSSWVGSVIPLNSEVQFNQQLQILEESVGGLDLQFLVTNPSPTNSIDVTVEILEGYNDFNESAPVTITIPANTTSFTASSIFTITDDADVESQETFTFNIITASGGQGSITIGGDRQDSLTLNDNDLVNLDLPFAESFETDGNGTRYTTSVTENITGVIVNDDYFSRTNDASIAATFSGSKDGSFFFAAQDIDAINSSSTQTLTISNINITGEIGLQLDILIAEDDAEDTNSDWDTTDYMHIDYRIDGGSYQNLIWVENDGVGTGSGFNSAPFIDTDFNGIGDGTEITDTWTNFNAAIAQTGSSLDIRITFNLDSGDEDIAIDNIRITGN